MHRFYLSAALSTVLLLTSTACTTQRFTEDKELDITRMEGSKASEASLCDDKRGRDILKRARERERLLLDLAKVKSPAAEMSPYGESMLKRPGKKENLDELTRAFLIVGFSKMQLRRASVEAQAAEAANSSNSTAKKAAGPSLEEELTEKGVDLLVELRKNPFLQSAEIYSIILQALQKHSEVLRQSSAESVHSILLEKLAEWQNLETSYQAFLNPNQTPTESTADPVVPVLTPTPAPAADAAAPAPVDPASPAAATPLPTESGTKTNAGTEVAPPAPTTPSEDLSSKPVPELLEKVQKFVEQNKYQEAITALKSIPKDSERAADVQAKIKEVCNKAVHELRAKAAKAFQSAMPVADSQIRRKYLLEAQKYLDTALSVYGEADQINVVKENLSVVNKNLENLK